MPDPKSLKYDFTHRHHWINNIKIKLIIYLANKDGETVFSQPKQGLVLAMIQITYFFLQNYNLNKTRTFIRTRRYEIDNILQIDLMALLVFKKILKN